MKPFCALLLVAIIAYVKGDDPCDIYAANTYPKAESSSGEHKDQVLPLSMIVDVPHTVNVVAQLTPGKVEGSTNKYCSVLTHGEGCLGAGHSRKIIQAPAREAKEGVNKLLFKTNYVAVTNQGYAIKYQLNIKGDNGDDYIFKAVDETITVIKLIPNGNGVQSEDLAQDVKNFPTVLAKMKSRFALFYAGNDFALYATCDATAMWVTYDEEARKNPKIIENAEETLNAEIAKLYQKMIKAGVKKDELPKLEEISLEMSPAFQNEVPV